MWEQVVSSIAPGFRHNESKLGKVRFDQIGMWHRENRYVCTKADGPRKKGVDLHSLGWATITRSGCVLGALSALWVQCYLVMNSCALYRQTGQPWILLTSLAGIGIKWENSFRTFCSCEKFVRDSVFNSILFRDNDHSSICKYTTAQGTVVIKSIFWYENRLHDIIKKYSSTS